MKSAVKEVEVSAPSREEATKFLAAAKGVDYHTIDIDDWDYDFVSRVMRCYDTFENQWNSQIINFHNAKLDSNIRDFVVDLINHGLHTAMCCSGHGVGEPVWVYFNTYVSEGAIREYMTTHWNEIKEYDLIRTVNGYGVRFFELSIPDKYREILGIEYAEPRFPRNNVEEKEDSSEVEQVAKEALGISKRV